MREVVA